MSIEIKKDFKKQIQNVLKDINTKCQQLTIKNKDKNKKNH